MPVELSGAVSVRAGRTAVSPEARTGSVMIDKQVVPGPGTVRVGRFIGRLGVVSMPAIAVGLDLDERVVRRHVAKLEKAGWLLRAPLLWGQGSMAWLTAAGNDAMGLAALRPIKSPPNSTAIRHGIRVGWTAARMERRGRPWISAREMDVDRDRWAVRTRCDRGITRQLPDLAIWVEQYELPCAVIVESGNRRNDRQKMILEGWRDAIRNGRYARVQYDCSNRSGAAHIRQLAKQVRLSESTFSAIVQPDADQITALAPAATDDDELPVSKPEPSADTEQPRDEHIQITTLHAPPAPAPAQIKLPEPPPEPQPETPEQAAARERRYHEIMGIPEPTTRRRWRR